jgi:hypothetical protein
MPSNVKDSSKKCVHRGENICPELFHFIVEPSLIIPKAYPQFAYANQT